MSFFDAEPVGREPPQPEYRPPEWSQPPENVMPAAVALDALIVSRNGVAVWVDAAFVYPTGVAFALTIVRRNGPADPRHGKPWFMHPGDPDGPRFGIGFSDGRRARIDRPGIGERQPDVVLSHQGGSGSDRRWAGRMWLWPLPPPGPLTFAFAWADERIDETTLDIDSTPLIAAAGRARELWSDDRPRSPEDRASSGGWTTYG